jgi:hypothetical protein
METMLGKILMLIVTVPAGWLGALVDLLEKMKGVDGKEWFDNLKLFLRKEPTWVTKVVEQMAEKVEVVVKKVLTPFITIRNGTTTTKETLIAEVEAVAAEVSDYAKSMIQNEAFTLIQHTAKTDLVQLSIADLGFTTNPRTDEFMTAKFCVEWSAKYLDGYVIELCQPEDGPQLRKQWKDQPKGTVVWCAMERLNDDNENLSVWAVGRDFSEALWLSGEWSGASGIPWNLNNVIVFRFRKITSPSQIL